MSPYRDYYCNNKFKFLKVDIEKKNTYVCHAAQPHRIDLEWLRNNPGEIFNTDINVQERQQMLRNERNSSCEQNCWFAEDKGGHGPRILEKGYERTHFEIRTRPEIIDLLIGSDCNLKCTYCCKEYSSTWRNEILQHGQYQKVGESERYSLTTMDQILIKQSQKDKFQSDYYQAILSELARLAKDAREVIITGGEPLLSNLLMQILDSLNLCKDIKIFTGLGVEFKRFEKIVRQIAKLPQARICISIENIEDHYEFNRFGMDWDDAQRKIALLQSIGVPVSMHSTLSNLTLFGFTDFYNRFVEQYKIEIDFVHNPKFMPVYVIDDDSKQNLVTVIESSKIPIKTRLLETLTITPTKDQRDQLASFMRQFQERNVGVDYKIFPESFLHWIS